MFHADGPSTAFAMVNWRAGPIGALSGNNAPGAKVLALIAAGRERASCQAPRGGHFHGLGVIRPRGNYFRFARKN